MSYMIYIYVICCRYQVFQMFQIVFRSVEWVHSVHISWCNLYCLHNIFYFKKFIDSFHKNICHYPQNQQEFSHQHFDYFKCFKFKQTKILQFCTQCHCLKLWEGLWESKPPVLQSVSHLLWGYKGPGFNSYLPTMG